MRKGSGKSAPSLDGLRARLTGAPPYEGALLELLRDDPRRGAQALYRRCLKRQSDAAAEQDRLERLMQFERELRAAGFQRVAGVDEAGRGPLAGPIVAAAVVLRGPVEGLNDSKQLSPVQRARAAALLRGSGHAVGTAVVGVDFIDRHGIQTANYAAMARAVAQLDPAPDFLLVDGFEIRGCGLPQKPLVKGDARSASIAAASIVAKVLRDQLMDELDRRFPGYGFASHKGYGTAQHVEALNRLGPCPAHRRSFLPVASRAPVQGLFEA